ncbi:MAG: hypothetical protein WCG80_08485 [Spirochaetales bacterium]
MGERELGEFLGWVNVVSLTTVVGLGLLLRFAGLNAGRKAVSLAHRVMTVVAVLSVALHFITVENRPAGLIILALAVVAIPLVTMVLKRMKKLSLAIKGKLVLVPFLALGLFVGHLTNNQSENGERGQGSGYFGEQEEDD